MKHSERVITPDTASPYVVAYHDIKLAIGMARVWLHSGWIDVVWKFRRTIIGPFWHTLGIAALVLVMGVIWSTVLNVDRNEYFKFVTINLIVWGLISSLVTEGTGIFISGQATALSMRFPYVAFAFSHVWRALLLFGHHFVLYVLVMIITLHNPGLNAFLAVPALILVLANGVWVSLFVGMITLKRRDFMPAVASIMQIMMFVTPVFWPKNLLGEKFAFAADLNPLYHMINIIREPLLGNQPQLESWLWSGGTLIIGSAVTFWLYGRYRERFSYWY